MLAESAGRHRDYPRQSRSCPGSSMVRTRDSIRSDCKRFARCSLMTDSERCALRPACTEGRVDGLQRRLRTAIRGLGDTSGSGRSASCRACPKFRSEPRYRDSRRESSRTPILEMTRSMLGSPSGLRGEGSDAGGGAKVLGAARLGKFSSRISRPSGDSSPAGLRPAAPHRFEPCRDARGREPGCGVRRFRA